MAIHVVGSLLTNICVENKGEKNCNPHVHFPLKKQEFKLETLNKIKR